MLGDALFLLVDQDSYAARIDFCRNGCEEKDVVHFCEYRNALAKDRGVDDKMIFVDQAGPDEGIGEGGTSIGDHVLAGKVFQP